MRIPITFFVSYAHADQRTADTFVQRLTEQLVPSKRYAYTCWRDTGLLVGERWHDEIQQALAACQVGLLLVSPAFLASQYITQQELPTFLGDDAKAVIPVMLKTIATGRFPGISATAAAGCTQSQGWFSPRGRLEETLGPAGPRVLVHPTYYESHRRCRCRVFSGCYC